MAFIDKYFDRDKARELRVVQPSKIFAEALRQASGSSFTRDLKYRIYYQIYAFYGVTDGVGTSTIVANTALAIAEAGLTVCVIDTSILAPSQDVLLNTEESVPDMGTGVVHHDWFDLPYIRDSPLHVSKITKNVSVLSFRGKNRGVVDFLSTNDSETLVTLALSTLHNKFDIILIDCCHEMSSVNTACLQQAQQVIQVWNDSPSVVSNMEAFITNAITLSCPLDKMRYVVYNKTCQDAMGSMDNMLKQYRLRHLGTSYFSEELYLKIVTGKTLYRCESTDPKVIEYTEFIIRIACHILNIDLEEKKEEEEQKKSKKKGKGTITSQDIMDGKVEGTLHHELREAAEQAPKVEVDRNPMGHPDFVGVGSDDDEMTPQEEQAEAEAEAAYAIDAMQYGGVMEEHDVTQEELVDADGDGVPDIFENPNSKRAKNKRRGLFGKKG